MDPFDRRREPRYAAQLQILVRVRLTDNAKVRPEECRMLNVSENGMSFIYRHLLAVGTSVTVEYQGCEVLGKVRNLRLREFGAEAECIAGVEIDRILHHKEVWLHLVKRNKQS